MGDLIKSIFGADAPDAPDVAGPSSEEIAQQTRQDALTGIKERRETSERSTRGRIISARAAGPQTLFTRRGSIPKQVKLGGAES